MTYGSLLFEFDAGVARITLNRPDAANALDLDLARELSDVALRCDEDRSVRAVVIGANGRFFCSGGDLAWFRGAGDAMPAAIKELATHLHTAISRFARMRAPVVMAVGGTAAGAGMSLACAGATEAYGITKRLVLSSFVESLESQMELEGRGIADAARTADAREGVEAFFAKRKPSFEGE